VAIDKALALSELEGALRQSVADLRSTLLPTTDRLTEQSADVIDQMRAGRRPFPGGGEERGDLSQDLAELRQRRAAANESALATLRGLLGPELAARVEPPAGAGGAEAGAVSLMVAPAGGGPPVAASVILQAAVAVPDSDPFIPGPIGGTDAQRYGDQLALDEGQREILAALHADYLESYAMLRDTKIKAALEAQRATRIGGPDVPVPAPSDVGRLYGLRRDAIGAIQARDAELIESLGAIAGDASAPAIERMGLARQRDVYRQGLAAGAGLSLPGMPPGQRNRGNPSLEPGAEESSVDLSRLVADLPDLQQMPAEADRVVLEYERAVTAVFRSAWESTLRVREEFETRNVEVMTQLRQAERTGERPNFGSLFQVMEESSGRALRESRRQITGLNRAALQELGAVLSPTARASLERAYQRQAFPDIFDDPLTPAARLDAALELTDLTPQQRSALGEIGAEFRGAYEAILQQMVALRSADQDRGQPGGPGGSERWQQRMESWRQMDRLRAERDDVAHTLLLRVRAVLTDEQANQIALRVE
jgi:hypothetical protein